MLSREQVPLECYVGQTQELRRVKGHRLTGCDNIQEFIGLKNINKYYPVLRQSFHLHLLLSLYSIASSTSKQRCIILFGQHSLRLIYVTLC